MTFEELVTGILLVALIGTYLAYRWCCKNVFLKCKDQKVGERK